MERFIEAVRQYPCLWDISKKEYRNMDIKEAAWISIVENLNAAEIKDVKEAKSEWKKLRDSHRDSLKRMKTRTGQAATNVNTWRYAEIMQFLLPCMRSRSKSTNLNSELSKAPEVPDEDNTNDSEISISNNEMNDAEADEQSYSYKSKDVQFAQEGRIEPRKRNADCDIIELLKEIKQSHQDRQEERQKDKDAIDLFFDSMAISVKSMPTWMRNRVKKKILQIVSESEEELENYGASDTPESAAAGSSHPVIYKIEHQE